MTVSPLRPDDLSAWTRSLVSGLLSYWPDVDSPDLPPIAIRRLVEQLSDRLKAGMNDVEEWSSEARVLADALEPVLSSSTNTSWAAEDQAVGSILRALYSAMRRAAWSDLGRRVFRQVEAVRQADAVGREYQGEAATELLAALMVVEDATMAIEGFAAAPPFLHVDEAYLAKYGLLQAFQAGLDATEAVGRCVGLRLDAWRAGGKSALEARNIVAGHPVGGTMAGETWHHFHDRATAHDNAVIRVMSFPKNEPGRWTGQTILTQDLIETGLQVMANLLHQCAEELGGRK